MTDSPLANSVMPEQGGGKTLSLWSGSSRVGTGLTRRRRSFSGCGLPR
jgi:hypothetical protein